MRIFITVLVTLFLSQSRAQQPQFSICNVQSPVPIDSLKKCYTLTTSDPNVLIQNFEVVFNSIQGMAQYQMGGKQFDQALMDHIVKGKPRELHLTITTLENRVEKRYKDITLLIKY